MELYELTRSVFGLGMGAKMVFYFISFYFLINVVHESVESVKSFPNTPSYLSFSVQLFYKRLTEVTRRGGSGRPAGTFNVGLTRETESL